MFSNKMELGIINFENKEMGYYSHLQIGLFPYMICDCFLKLCKYQILYI